MVMCTCGGWNSVRSLPLTVSVLLLERALPEPETAIAARLASQSSLRTCLFESHSAGAPACAGPHPHPPPTPGFMWVLEIGTGAPSS